MNPQHERDSLPLRAGVIILAVLGALFLVQGTWIWTKALVAQVMLRDAWDQTRDGAGAVPPWPWADTHPVGRLISEAHEVDLIVLEGASGATMAFGPGRLPGSALPGHGGHVVLTAHRDTHFAFLESLKPGDRLWLESPDGRLTRYTIDRALVVHETDTHHLQPTTHDQLTLLTCYPFDSPAPGTDRRYLVRATPDLVSTQAAAAPVAQADPPWDL